MQGLSLLLSADQDHGQILDLIIGQLPLKEHGRVARACKAFATAARGAVRCFRVSTTANVLAAATAVAVCRYPQVVELRVVDSAAASCEFWALLALLAPKLQLFHIKGPSHAAIPGLISMASYNQLQNLVLDLPIFPAFHQHTLLDSALGQLTLLTQLTLSMGLAAATAPSPPLTSLTALSQLQQLTMAKNIAAVTLPPNITTLTLAGSAAAAALDVASSSCLHLQQLHLQQAVISASTADWFWDKLQPLTALTALEGSINTGDSDFQQQYWSIGPHEATSWRVLQRLQRLCLGSSYKPAFYDGMQVSGFIWLDGDLSTLTQLTALWVEIPVPEDVTETEGGPPSLPLNLRELRVRSSHWNMHLGALSSLTRLTWEANEVSEDYVNMSYNVPYEVIEELTLLVGLDTSLGSFKIMPKLRVLRVKNCCFDAGMIGCLLHLAPALEDVHFYFDRLTRDGDLVHSDQDLAKFRFLAIDQLYPLYRAPRLSLWRVDLTEDGARVFPY